MEGKLRARADRVYAFDGSPFCVRAAVVRYRAEFGARADALLELWRAKQLGDAWTAALTARGHRPIAAVLAPLA